MKIISNHPLYQNCIVKPLHSIKSHSTIWLKAESQYIKEKPVEAITLIVLKIASVALLIIALCLRNIYFQLAAGGMVLCFHAIRCVKIIPKVISLETLHYIQNHAIEKTKNKEIFLILKSQDDPFLLGHETILEKQYPLAMRVVSNITEVCQAIDDAVSQGNIIKGLFLHAHGDPSAIVLGKENLVFNRKMDHLLQVSKIRSISQNELKELKFSFQKVRDRQICELNVAILEPALKKLSKDAVIVLKSCSTACALTGGKNIAQRIAEFAGGRKIIAPAAIISCASTVINPRTLGVKFYKSPKVSTLTEIKWFFVKRMSCLQKYRDNFRRIFEEDVTRIYQYPV